MTEVANLIKHAMNGNATDFQESFGRIMNEKILEAVSESQTTNRKQSLYNKVLKWGDTFLERGYFGIVFEQFKEYAIEIFGEEAEHKEEFKDALQDAWNDKWKIGEA